MTLGSTIVVTAMKNAMSAYVFKHGSRCYFPYLTVSYDFDVNS